MDTGKYSAEEIARQAGVPVCLVHYYAHIGLLGELEKPLPTTFPNGLELVGTDAFIQCATAAGVTYEEMACLLELNERADGRGLRLAAQKLAELIERQRCITRLQTHLETRLFEHCAKPEISCFIT